MMCMRGGRNVAPVELHEDRVFKQNTERHIAEAGSEEAGSEACSEACSEASLRRITGEEDLSVVRNLVLTVDTNEIQVDHLGILMPLLSELRLERGSTLASFRDLGSSLSNLRVVWLSACGIRHLDGVGALTGLEELYLAFNDVEDLTSIALHERLEVLDLESNSVRDAEQAIQLGTCPRLWSLTLTANPLCRDRHYRRAIIEAVPQLASLDEENVTDDDRRPPPTPSEEEKDDKHALLSSEQTVSPPHRQASTSDCNEQVYPAGARGFSPKQFLRGSAGAGNRNLRELEVLETNFSREQKSRGEDVLTALDMSGTTETGYRQATTAASPFTTGCLASSSSWPKPRLCGSVCGGCDDGGLPSRPVTTAADGFNTVAKHAQHSMQGGQNSEIGERLAGEGTPPPDRGGVPSFMGSVQRDRREDGCLELSSGSETFSAFVDEEEMVVKAIKNFRLISNTNPSKKCSTISSPRQPLGAADRALPAGGCACCNVARERCAERRVGEGNGGKGAGRKGATENNPPAQGYGRRTSEIDSVGCPLGGTRGRAEERASGDGTRCRQSTEARDAWEGNNWILEVLRLQDMGSDAGTSLSQAATEGRNDATSALTHGSEMSIAGNPAFGLRRRRGPDETGEGGRRTKDWTSTPASIASEPCHQANDPLGDGTTWSHPSVGRNGNQLGLDRTYAEARVFRKTRAREPATQTDAQTEKSVENDHNRAKGEGLEAPPDAATEGTGGGGGGGGDLDTNSVLVPAWPRLGSGYQRQDCPPDVVASLACRALLSPASLPQPRNRRGLGPPATGDTCTATGAESFAIEEEISPPPVTTTMNAVTGVGGNRCRRRRRTPSGTNSGESWRTFGSRSAAALHSVATREGDVGDESRRVLRPASGHCGAGGLDGNADPERDSRRQLRESEGTATLCGGFQDGSQRDRCTRNSRTPSDVPEWSPTGAVGDVCENGSGCGGSCWDGGFPFVDDDCDGDGGGGCCGGEGCGGGAGEHTRDKTQPLGSCSGSSTRAASSAWKGCREDAPEPGTKHILCQHRQHDTNLPGVPGVTGLTELRKKSGGGDEDEGGGCIVGEGTAECDEKLVELLRKRPKDVPQIRTREAFRNFFRGMERDRLRRLLREAYADRGAVECDAKVKKRLMLLESSLGASLR